jgi:hypothetical protein
MQSRAVHYYKLEFDKTSGQISTFTGQWLNQAAQGDAVAQAWIYASEPKLGNQGKYRIYPSRPQQLPLPSVVHRALLAAGQ